MDFISVVAQFVFLTCTVPVVEKELFAAITEAEIDESIGSSVHTIR